jgi:hypothetical protein
MALYRWQELRQLRHAWYDEVLSKTASTTGEADDRVRAETKHFIYFYLGHMAILLFKTQ